MPPETGMGLEAAAPVENELPKEAGDDSFAAKFGSGEESLRASRDGRSAVLRERVKRSDSAACAGGAVAAAAAGLLSEDAGERSAVLPEAAEEKRPGVLPDAGAEGRSVVLPDADEAGLDGKLSSQKLSAPFAAGAELFAELRGSNEALPLGLFFFSSGDVLFIEVSP